MKRSISRSNPLSSTSSSRRGDRLPAQVPFNSMHKGRSTKSESEFCATLAFSELRNFSVSSLLSPLSSLLSLASPAFLASNYRLSYSSASPSSPPKRPRTPASLETPCLHFPISTPNGEDALSSISTTSCRMDRSDHRSFDRAREGDSSD